ncbi:hypothetical protein CBR_g30778 [Chara braunii]|uniref:Uncharacterized protein n=1 Tax=Chara braunii TaxID=69332 RepID=A0A388JXF3_CHABU|nr:hypothetical protein CBR_g30778 [Chara braunii]|eukprot:GBG62457.1 hypothetical protein CBR_g30778 [Chara braunii]
MSNPMFPAGVSPEMLKFAQEQMKRMKPEDIRRMQQQMNVTPESIKMAQERLKSVRADDMKYAAEQLGKLSDEQLSEMTRKMAQSDPEQLKNAARAYADRSKSRQEYEYQAALRLKQEGNHLHGQGKYNDAAEKYQRAKKNLSSHSHKDSVSLRTVCSVNLISCYLKSKQYEAAISEGTEVLRSDPKNLKALYRRGLAYKEAGKLELAAADLQAAAELDPTDETIEGALRKLKADKVSKDHQSERGNTSDDNVVRSGTSGEESEDLLKRSMRENRDGVIISEEEDGTWSVRGEKLIAQRVKERSPYDSLSTSGGDDADFYGETDSGAPFGMQDREVMQQMIEMMSKNSDMARQMHSLMTSMTPEQVAAMSGGGIDPTMAKFAVDVAKGMTPEDMERVVSMAGNLPRSTDPGQERREKDSGATSGANTSSAVLPKYGMPSGVSIGEDMGRTQSEGTASVSGLSDGGSGSSADYDSSSRTGLRHRRTGSGGGAPAASMGMGDMTPEMREQMREQLKNPAAAKMMTEMMKSLSPETMAAMSEKFGMKMTPEQARKAQEAMSSLRPEDLDSVMRWAERVQKASEAAKSTKNWLLGRQGLVLAIALLLVAVLGHVMGIW